MNIDQFKNDHVKILISVDELRQLVKGGVEKNAILIATAIVKMSSSIKAHLAAEDTLLYPVLAKSSNVAVSNAAIQFQTEMGGIAAAYVDFAKKWNLVKTITTNPAEFKDHANAIFKALNQRIQQENKTLYPLAESNN
jgi:hemerythrin-like domain-containing protein